MKFVYAASDGVVMWGQPPAPKSVVRLTPNEIWYADDPFVQARPDLFSATPLVVHSTQGRDAPERTPVQPGDLAAGGVVPGTPVVTISGGGEILPELKAAVRRDPRSRSAARA